MALLIEALVVMAFLMFSLAVFARLFASAQVGGVMATRKSEAVLAASDVAEEFSANPTKVASSSEVNGLVVTCEVTPEAKADGTLYHATIVVSHDTDELYRLDTARYVSGDRS